MGDDPGGTSGKKRRHRLTGGEPPVRVQPPPGLLSPRTQDGGGGGGSSSENVWEPNRCVVRNELGAGRRCGQGAGPLGTPDAIGWPARASRAPPPALPQDVQAPPPSRPRPGCYRPSHPEAWRRGRPALIGQFISDCSVMCYHNNPPREANRERLVPRTGPTGCTKLHRAPSVPPLHSSHPKAARQSSACRWAGLE